MKELIDLKHDIGADSLTIGIAGVSSARHYFSTEMTL